MSRTLVAKPDTVPVWAESGEKVKPSNPEIAEGWPLSATPPSRQRFNWILGHTAQMVQYLMQHGIPKWDTEERYAKDAVVVHESMLWIAKRENISANPKTQHDDWAGAASAIGGSDGVDLMTLIEQLQKADVIFKKTDINLQEQIDNLKASAGGGVTKITAGNGINITPSEGTGNVKISSSVSFSPTTSDGGVLNIGPWRIIVGATHSITGYKDVVTMPQPLKDLFVISISEHNVIGWGAPGEDGVLTQTVTAFGTAIHPDPDKFYLSVATWDIHRQKWFYPGLTTGGGQVAVQYIAIGSNPDWPPANT